MEEVKRRLRQMGAPVPLEVDGSPGLERWVRLLERVPPANTAAVVRVGLPPRHVEAFWQTHGRWLERGPLLVDVPHGLIYVHAEHDDDASAQAWLKALTARVTALDGYTWVVDAPPAWSLARWRRGYMPDTLELMRALKRCWDPKNVLEDVWGLLVDSEWGLP
ncbi:MAG: hypothetical protein Q9O62_00840 [Ardenticatenia bacterium]|nr:hypothetical protein [Ardenticatenia bacterium]